MAINRNMFGYEIKKTLNNRIVETININTYGVGRVRASLALLFAVCGCFGIVEKILEY